MYERICDIPLFADLSDDQIIWLEEHSSEVELASGDYAFHEAAPADAFYVLLQGELRITKKMGGEQVILATHQSGAFTGEIPLLTNTPYIASARAVGTTRILRICAEDFILMLTVCSPVNSTILPAMAKRLQAIDNNVRQYEKMSALGKLAAGLAHDLNNPAAAAQRSVKQLRENINQLQSTFIQLSQLNMEQLQWLIQFQQEICNRRLQQSPLDALAQYDHEEEITTWLDNHAVGNSWIFAPSLATAGVFSSDLEKLATAIPHEALSNALTLINLSLDLDELFNGIDNSTAHISELVKAIKSYAYMDQTPQQDVDIHTGIDNALALLNHKLSSAVKITKSYAVALPKIQAYGSELNQVWTNLLDNAIDAMEGKGEISVTTAIDGDHIVVTITDTGPGIPQEIQNRIFEPFFTTKPVGKGTGLGLDTVYRSVVQRHHGSVTLKSQPGDTQFMVRLPFVIPT